MTEAPPATFAPRTCPRTDAFDPGRPGVWRRPSLGITLVAADSPHSVLDDTPTSTLVRQIIGAVSRSSTGRLQLRVADLLDHQVAGEPTPGVDDNVAGAVARDVGQQGRAARARLDRVGAGDGRVVELADDPVAEAPGERLNRLLFGCRSRRRRCPRRRS
jgi:hypothetical protein